MNSDVLDPDLIAPSGPVSNIEVKKTFEVPQNYYDPKGIQPVKQTVSDGPLGAQVPGELPKVDIDFKIIDDQKTKIIGFQEVEAILLGNQTISQETAQFIEHKIPGFLLSDKDILRFTKQPSVVGYSKALNYVKNKIAVESESLYQNLGSMIKEYYINESATVDHFIANELDSFLYSIETFVSDATELYNKIKFSKNASFVDSDGTFKNILKDPLSTLKNSSIKPGESSEESKYTVILDALKSTISIVEKNALNQLLFIVTNPQESASLYFEEKISVTDDTLETNFDSLLNSVLSTKFASTVRSIFEEYNNYKNKQQSVINNVLDLDSQDSVSMTMWYLENEKNTKSLITNVHKLKALTALIPALLISIKVFCETLLSIK
jgi:hypothetical protein